VTEEYYQSLQAEYKDFVDTCCESYPIFRNWSSFMTWADGIEQKIAQLTAERDGWIARNARQEQHFDKFMIEYHELQNECAEWWQDAERLAILYEHDSGFGDGNQCIHCGGVYGIDNKIKHALDCPITLHRALVEKYKKEVVR
jgi:hypothetical protein